MESKRTESKWCVCVESKPELLQDIKLSYWCKVCNMPVPCEVCRKSSSKDIDILQATTRVMGRYFCKKHANEYDIEKLSGMTNEELLDEVIDSQIADSYDGGFTSYGMWYSEATVDELKKRLRECGWLKEE